MLGLDVEQPLPGSIVHQGIHVASVYAFEFQQLACDIQWDGQALCNHFRRGFRSEIKNHLLNIITYISNMQSNNETFINTIKNIIISMLGIFLFVLSQCS
mgnify:CR=1 FL=1